jgi:hypothetical protein
MIQIPFAEAHPEARIPLIPDVVYVSDFHRSRAHDPVGAQSYIYHKSFLLTPELS